MANKYGILMPDTVIYNSLNAFLDIIKKDYVANAADLSKSILNILFDKDENELDIDFETFDYLVQAKSLFIDKKVQVNIGYNLETAAMACIHILLPNESGSPFGIGADENYQPQINTVVDAGTPDEETFAQEIFTKRFESTYQLIITSENIFEVLLIYYYIKSCLISLNYHLELMGLRNLRIGGQDINIQQDSIPTHIFHRTLTLNFFYESNVPNFLKSKIIKQFQATGINNTNP